VDPPASHGVPRAPCYSGTLTITQGSRFCIPDYHRLRLTFPGHSAGDAFVTAYQRPQPRGASSSVWAVPLSLAATNGVSVDFLSCRYLDVSVPCVGSGRTMHSSGGEGNWLPSANGLPHWEIPGLTVAWHLPRAYRSLPRPSSPLDAKTSPIHP
jgi:hypothetical protein